MPKHKRVDVSSKSRRLVERMLKLHVEKATAVFQPTEKITLAESNAARESLNNRTRESKRKLLEHIQHLESPS